MELFQNDVNDKSIKVSGETRCITTPDDHDFPINIQLVLPYMSIRDEWKILPHVILTSDDEWDPTILDYSIDDDDADNDELYDAISDDSTRHNNTLFDCTR